MTLKCPAHNKTLLHNKKQLNLIESKIYLCVSTKDL